MRILRLQEYKIITIRANERNIERYKMIFIHSSFRTSSTYIWSKLRECENTVAYYEIFHESLARATRKSIESDSPTSWYSKHPRGAPYFLEFIPLLKEDGGVLGFDPAFSFDRYIPETGPDGKISDLEVAYINRLILHAEQIKKIPVLTETRTIGRVSGIKAAIPGLHVLLYRNLFQQWCSYTEQSRLGNKFFLYTTDLILKNATHDRFLNGLNDLFPVNIPSEHDINSFYRFIFTHVYLYAHAACNVDLIIDVNQISENHIYRRNIEEKLESHQLIVDLSDARSSISYSMLENINNSEFRQCLRVVGDLIQSCISIDAGRVFADKAIIDLYNELICNKFHTNSIRLLLNKSVKDRDAALAMAEEAQNRLSLMQAEHDIAQVAESIATTSRDMVPKELNTALETENATVHSSENLFAEHDSSLPTEVMRLDDTDDFNREAAESIVDEKI
jgi:hypothetical protein